MRRAAVVIAFAFAFACSGEDTEPTDAGTRDGGIRDAGEATVRDGGPARDGGVRDGGARDGGPRDGGLTLDEQLAALIAIQDPPVTAMPEAPAITTDLYELGQALFFDPILSGNFDVACASCHHPAYATGDALPLSVGTGATGLGPTRADPGHPPFVRRHAPELFNRGHPEWNNMFWDGRVATATLPPGLDSPLAKQALFPLLDRVEMRGQDGDLTLDGTPNELAAIDDRDPDAIWAAIMVRLLGIPEYEMRFAAAFPELGMDPPTIVHVANAIAAYQATAFAATDTRWDRYLEGDLDALNAAEKLGALIFYGPAECGRCHSGVLMTDQRYHNNAVPQIGPGHPFNAPYDHGRENVTGLDTDRYAFRTPPLRNVAETAPYMHNGVLVDMTAVLTHYAYPLESHERLNVDDLHPDLRSTLRTDPMHVADLRARVSPELLIAADVRSTVGLSNIRAFLNSLTDSGFENLQQAVPPSVPSGRTLP